MSANAPDTASASAASPAAESEAATAAEREEGRALAWRSPVRSHRRLRCHSRRNPAPHTPGGSARAQLVVFPEYSSHFSTPLGPNALAAAEPLDGPFATELAAIARKHGVVLVAGLVESADDDHFYNTLVAFDTAGELVARYRKVHLYDAFGVRRE